MSYARQFLIWGHLQTNLCAPRKAFNRWPNRRRMSTDGSAKAKPSSPSLYNKIMNVIDPLVPSKLRPLWEHEAGPKTIFFWAPLMKGSLVVASLKDLTRPPDAISPRQSASLAFTGVLWSRWSLVIIPKNYLMFAVNFFVFLTQAVQTTRAIMHSQMSAQK